MGSAGLPVGLGHLRQATGLADDQVIGQDDGDRVVAGEVTGAPDRVSQAEGMLLAGVGDLSGGRGAVPDPLQRLGLPAAGQHVLQLHRLIEIVLDRVLAPSGHEDELFDAGRPRLLERVLDQRLVDHRQQFLGQGLGCRQEPGPQPADRQDGFANRGGHRLLREGHGDDAGVGPRGRVMP